MTQPVVVKRSNLIRVRPRFASTAAAPSAKQYKASVRRAANSIAARKRLPITQQQFYARRLTQR